MYNAGKTPYVRKIETTETQMPFKILAGYKHLAEKTVDAYSADRYASWENVAKLLLRHGYSERQAEAIMRSKWARWAGDQHGGAYGKLPAYIVRDFAIKQGWDEVNKLTEEHFAHA